MEKQWMISWAVEGTDDYFELLSSGWEPFAIIKSAETFKITIYFKRLRSYR